MSRVRQAVHLQRRHAAPPALQPPGRQEVAPVHGLRPQGPQLVQPQAARTEQAHGRAAAQVSDVRGGLRGQGGPQEARHVQAQQGAAVRVHGLRPAVPASPRPAAPPAASPRGRQPRVRRVRQGLRLIRVHDAARALPHERGGVPVRQMRPPLPAPHEPEPPPVHARHQEELPLRDVRAELHH